MDKAKAAVSGFLSKDGKHNTTVHETINPAIQRERVTRTEHENAQTAIDREVHQDHYHTSVQPIHHKEVLPEQHKHNLVGVEHRTIDHGNHDHVRQRLEAEKAQFQNTREVSDTKHTRTDSGVTMGEHIHHHVHENIQPVIHKETIQPTVVHTTVPIHETHHNEAKHHNATQLPALTMDEFTRQGGHLKGREERTDAFDGEPKAVGTALGGHGARGSTSLTEKENSHVNHNHNHNHDNTTTEMNGTGKKPGLLAKLNPRKDADGDGKAGFMD